ncbi:transposase [Corynebacterium flavescens]|uniref:Transposase n=1 Tax=Corynebacterium flavescens TaxID=28028 RepID=A0A1L7CPM6_CORFL|nr:transposase [Corynebacterium flavescens]
MPSKTYSKEFRRDVVALYENSDGASIQKIATDLGINRVTLKNGITKYGSTASTRNNNAATAVSVVEQNRQLKRENALLREERDILRKAAKYFAEETPAQ